ncbi:UNVERIFIED_CONTAM: hypothetical protein Slati_0185600 [Sesamum latifolium]|uniref:Reverse transcriptase zinc-binding domain-containing protein n=1 Tax=Sesamum latifolium TaxID=2727402 RepID=A0AAW2YBA9_9LAMI
MGVSICTIAPSISHLLFVDDTLIFCRASLESTQAVQDTLEVYRLASGQKINFSNKSVVFSRNMKEDICSHTVDDLSIKRENKLACYLGLLSRVAQSKWNLFATIRDKVWARIIGWNAKLFSQAGREVLIKSVIQAIPTYVMGYFRLPVTLLREIREKLLSRVLRARYFSNGDIFLASLGTRPSFSILATQNLFRARCRWRVGSGSHIHVWTDPWIPRPHSFKPVTLVLPSLSNLRVADLIDPICRDWRVEQVRVISAKCLPSRLFSEHKPCSSFREADKSFWWRKIWQAKLPNKVKVFLWCACLDALPMGSNLSKRISGFQSGCPFCHEDQEDIFHTLVHCIFARQVWGLTSIAADFRVRGNLGALQQFRFVSQ